MADEDRRGVFDFGALSQSEGAAEAGFVEEAPGAGGGRHRRHAGTLVARSGSRAFTVVHRVVFVRAAPSVKSDALGILHHGTVVSGTPKGSWLHLSDACRRSIGIRRGAAEAWVLRDGRELGLGTLLADLLVGSATSGAGDRAASGENSRTYTVVHRAVVVRAAPSVRAEKRGLLVRGEQVKGTERDGWLQLDNASTGATKASGKAFVLIDGASVGFGPLLKLLSPGGAQQQQTAAQPPEPPAATTTPSGAAAESATYTVVHKAVFVRAAPSVQAPQRGVLLRGRQVRGTVNDGWLRLCAADALVSSTPSKPAFVLIHGASLGLGPLLAPIPVGPPPGVDKRREDPRRRSKVTDDSAARATVEEAPQPSPQQQTEEKERVSPDAPSPAAAATTAAAAAAAVKAAGCDASRSADTAAVTPLPSPSPPPDDPEKKEVEVAEEPQSEKPTEDAATTAEAKVVAYEVVHRAVIVRAAPSVQAGRLGMLLRGQQVKGTVERNGWLRLSAEDTAAATGTRSQQAFVLIDGATVGLGKLLAPASSGRDFAEELVRSPVSADVAAHAKAAYLSPLVFEADAEAAASLLPRSLPQGDMLRGYAVEDFACPEEGAGNESRWLRLRSQSGQQLLVVKCLKPRLRCAFSEALIVAWSELPVHRAEYCVEWKYSKDVGAAPRLSVRSGQSTGSCAHLRGLRSGESILFRIVARVLQPVDDAAGGGGAAAADLVATVASCWAEASTLSPIDLGEDAKMAMDPLGAARGRCRGDCCSCSAFVLSRYSYVQQLDDVLCRRCGCSCLSHTVDRKGAEDGQSRGLNAAANAHLWTPHGAANVGCSRLAHILKQVGQAQNLYATLGVRIDTGARELRTAYRQICRHIHPDKVQHAGEEDAGLLEQAEAAFKLVAAAYEVLGDESRRRDYDRTLAERRPAASSKCRVDAEDMSFFTRFHAGGFWWRSHDSSRGKRGSADGAAKIIITVRHAITGDFTELEIQRGTTVDRLKQLLSAKVRRGPVSRIELAGENGKPLAADGRMREDRQILCVGISLGARYRVAALDTCTLGELRRRVAADQGLDDASLRVGLPQRGTRQFAQLPEDELLNGRELFWVQGLKATPALSLEAALALQADLIQAYSAEAFQARLSELLQEYPFPMCLQSVAFREGYSKLLAAAQQPVLPRWGFTGDFASHNMVAAFSEVAGHPDVQQLTDKIDALLRITKAGMVVTEAEMSTVKKRLSGGEEAAPVQLKVRQVVSETDSEKACTTESADDEGSVLVLTMLPTATFRDVKQAIAEKTALAVDCSGGSMRLAYRLGASTHGAEDVGRAFAALGDDELVGSFREVFVLGGLGGEAAAASQVAAVPQADTQSLRSLSVSEATALQTELFAAYSSERFQVMLQELFSRYPSAPSWHEMTFRKEYTQLVQTAQRGVLEKWGFHGEAASHNMMAAFRGVLAEGEVKRLAEEIDKLLRITQGGFIMSQADLLRRYGPTSPDGKSRVVATCEVRLHEAVAATQPVGQSAQEMPPVTVVVGNNATCEDLKQAIVEQLHLRPEEADFRLAYRLGQQQGPGHVAGEGAAFAAFRDGERLGSRRDIFVMGMKLPRPSDGLQSPV
eukprot:TRINITY_DN21876_c0_g2_i2.p1 TRINITY_DN21876_c0_g2~~TRINITY_DN21876_c0_g2_i2.p1  ORF type:complete len:1597 (-),score=422.33 TRINITY_DN21876_c0_g2_i2:336-5126(-)